MGCMSSSYREERLVAYLLDICSTLSRGMIIDNHRHIVDMHVYVVSTSIADVLGEREYDSNIGQSGRAYLI